MTLRELLWFAAQINANRWRFFYARMAIKSRLQRLPITAPPERLPDVAEPLHQRISRLASTLEELSALE